MVLQRRKLNNVNILQTNIFTGENYPIYGKSHLCIGTRKKFELCVSVGTELYLKEKVNSLSAVILFPRQGVVHACGQGSHQEFYFEGYIMS